MDEFYNNLYNQLLSEGFIRAKDNSLIKLDAGNMYIINPNEEIYKPNCSRIYIINIIAFYEFGEKEKDILNREINLEQNTVYIYWGVDLVNKNMVILNNQPKKFLNIEKSIYSVLNGEKAQLNYNKTRTLKTPICTYFLIFIFILIYFVFRKYNMFIKFGISPTILEDKEYYRLITYMFLHSNLEHLISNIISLYIFGSIIERYFGRFAFWLIYLIGGVASAIFSIIFNNSYSVGASGAIFALISASMYFAKKENIEPNGISFYIMLIIAIINIFSGFIYNNIDNAGHIGGFLSGFIVCIIYYKKIYLKRE